MKDWNYSLFINTINTYAVLFHFNINLFCVFFLSFFSVGNWVQGSFLVVKVGDTRQISVASATSSDVALYWLSSSCSQTGACLFKTRSEAEGRKRRESFVSLAKLFLLFIPDAVFSRKGEARASAVWLCSSLRWSRPFCEELLRHANMVSTFFWWGVKT